MKFDELKNREQKAIIPTYGRYPIALSHGKGSWVYDLEGKEYLDFLSGLAVCNLGHSHPRLVQAISDQAAKLIHTSNLYYTDNQVRLAERIAGLSFSGKTFFCNSGAEANEAAIKLARKRGNAKDKKKNKILSLKMSFHGRTVQTITLTGQPKLQEGFDPLPNNFFYVEPNNSSELEQAFDKDVCALFLEAVQGEAGVFPLDEDFVKKARELCDQYDALLIIDEVQTGVWRTGKFLGSQYFSILPDVFTLAKGLANGLPIGALHASEECMDVLGPKTHASTFGGNPLASRAALEVIDVMEEEIVPGMDKVLENLWNTMKELKQQFSIIQEIRGRGFMIALGLKQDAPKVLAAMHDNGLLGNAIGENTIRFLPPLIIGDHEIAAFKDKMTAVLNGF